MDKKPDGYIEVTNKFAVYVTKKCDCCGLNYVPDGETSCPKCRIKEEVIDYQI
jgi:uncharacterized Zn finger protein (UPF0148 family)